MLAHLENGISAAEAARLTLAQDGAHAGAVAAGTVGSPALGDLASRLRRALDEFDEAAAQAALDRLLAAFSTEAALREAVIPYLHELGERWARGESSVAQEHFATAILRGRLLGLARGWGAGGGPLGLLACVPGDQHDLGLICFGLALRGHGWSITFLGPDTPASTLSDAARQLRPARVIVSATVVDAVAVHGLSETVHHAPLAIAGAGANSAMAQRLGAVYLEEDPITAAASVASMVGSPS